MPYNTNGLRKKKETRFESDDELSEFTDREIEEAAEKIRALILLGRLEEFMETLSESRKRTVH